MRLGSLQSAPLLGAPYVGLLGASYAGPPTALPPTGSGRAGVLSPIHLVSKTVTNIHGMASLNLACRTTLAPGVMIASAGVCDVDRYRGTIFFFPQFGDTDLQHVVEISWVAGLIQGTRLSGSDWRSHNVFCATEGGIGRLPVANHEFLAGSAEERLAPRTGSSAMQLRGVLAPVQIGVNGFSCAPGAV
jgi:hypothetical protein